VVAGELLERAGAQAVDAAVADVAEDGAAGAQAGDGDGRAHLGERAAAGLDDLLGGQAGGDGHLVLVGGEPAVGGVGPGDVVVAGVAADEVDDGGDGETARHLASLVAAHPVGHGEQAQLGQRAAGVLVVAAAADVAEEGVVELHDRRRRASRVPGAGAREERRAWGVGAPARGARVEWAGWRRPGR
jgi:hypothetical protein